MTASPARPPAARLVAILVFIGLPALFIALTVLNGLQVATDRLTAADKQAQAAALERRLGTTGPNGGTGDVASVYVIGSSKTAAIADLQQRIVDAVAQASGELIETAAVEDVDASGDAGGIAVKATLDIDNDGLLRLLYGLESGTPLMTVDPLSVRRLPDATQDATAGKLRVDMTVGAQWRPGTP